ncbi:hypothetical protein [Paraburkholderia sp. GAS32]|uniref:hypothetical protein n=1 Tax=Paraburkholderia sp. GAS32 TaxID=3035129 RepID=UPI003D248A12
MAADNAMLIKNLFAAMQDALFLGDPLLKGEFVSFMAPGQFVDTKSGEQPGTDAMAVQTEICNVLIDTSYVNNRNSVESGTSKELVGSVNQVYHDVLNHAALPHRDLGSAQKEIDALTTWLMANKPIYDQYSGFYDDATSAYDTERAKQNPNSDRLRRLADARKRAYSDWETLGKKNLYEAKKARIIYLSAESPETLWANFITNMESSREQAPNKGEYFSTFLSPPLSQWDKGEWASFQQTISEQDQYQYSHETSWSGGVSAGWGLWSVGGEASGSTQYTHQDSEETSVTLKFDYMRVRIIRPWLVPDVFAYRFWTWRKEYGFQFLSDGGNLNTTPPQRPVGRMPVLPQYLIVVRNVELTSNFSKKVQDDYASQVSGGVSVGYGPFSVSGHYSESTQTHYYHADFDGFTFKIAQPQIIARSGIMLPKSPDPIESLPWQGDEVFPPKAFPKALRKIRDQDYKRMLAFEAAEEIIISINRQYREAIRAAKRNALPPQEPNES